MSPFRIGIVINPVAGVGGPAALKGSDGNSAALAAARDYKGVASQRMARALQALPDACELHAVPGVMGGDLCRVLGRPYRLHPIPDADAVTTAAHTRAAVRVLQAHSDLIVFAGGDGTARDVQDALAPGQPALGVPAGVKMHSGVFARSPEAAADLLARLARGEVVGAERAEVRDIDEDQLRRGEINARFYGEMLVPGDFTWLASTKVGGKESEGLAQVEIAAWFVESLLDTAGTWFIGAGTTTRAIKMALGDPGTLLGVDVFAGAGLSETDVDEHRLAELAGPGCRILVSVTGGQGFVFGRGSQQFSPRVIRAAGGAGAILIAATRTKLAGLEGRLIGIDTGDPALDAELAGVWPVLTGYSDEVLCRLG